MGLGAVGFGRLCGITVSGEVLVLGDGLHGVSKRFSVLWKTVRGAKLGVSQPVYGLGSSGLWGLS